MRTKYTTIVAIICGILYVSALLFAILTISNSIKERKAQAQQDFLALTDKAAAAAVLGFMADPFRESVKDTLESSSVLAAVMISNGDGVVYAIEKKPGYLVWLGSEPQFVQNFGLTKPPFVRPIPVEGYRNVTVSAVAEEIDYNLIKRILLNSLLAILIALVLAIGTVAFSGTSETATETESIYDNKGVNKQTSPSNPLMDDLPFEIPDMDATVFKPAVEEAVSDCKDSPRGLYTPLLSVSWEDYTKERLEAELHRSASFEQDLTVLIIAFPELTYTDYPDLFKMIADHIVAFFTFRDLIFEWKGNGFCILLPNIDLDHSFKMAEEFSNKLFSKINSEVLRRTIWGIGLSSRSGRLLDADRLLLEASRALEKALEDKKSPIVAFKSDPERYRAYISSKTS